ncbi:hypothetical protein UFOVP1319_13 [uncultured Caudovirales phage]|uniref:Uncharacterized protein n=1 Tax=uncultured Caudovirales phage TaxID=2100421 RepID=A0A6J5RCY2_9CAUD|nr:hypothetical protein UFOVP478_48 [uncultured Caudovirales phage]CAB4191311.1 hypothetical protein UFOVP1225_23 [uncultured Caudovirales phage]CAB4197411.1 hypothetical protein UFOVP1319_13 [uncultured Caudovirales phage]CAB4217375.1 hypothetical protein UFOVP1591_23 [uncultured Caudovirales phage]
MASIKNKGPLLYFSKFGGEQPIPPEFIAKMNRAEEIQAVPNDVTPETLSDTIVESRVETNRTDERVRHTIKKDAGNITLTDILQDKDGQVVTRTRVLYPVGTTATAATALMQVEVHSLGNGWAIEERSVVAAVFPGSSVVNKQLVTIPEKYVSSAATLSTVATIASGTTTTPSTLGTGGTGVVETQSERIDAFKIKTSATTLTATAATATEYALDKDGQLVTISNTYIDTSAAAPTASATNVIIERQVLGAGKAVQKVGAISTVFPGNVAENHQTGSYPVEFLSNNAKLSTTTLISSGTTVTAPSLGTGGTGVVSGTAMRIDAFKIKTESTSLSGGVSTSKTEGALDEGLPVTITTSLISDSVGVPSSGSLLTVLQTQQLQGNGYAVKKVGVVSSYPTRYGQNYNPKLNLVVPWTETTIAPGASGTAKTDINPVDYAKQRNRTYGSVTTAYDAVFFSGVGNTVVDLPNVLTSLSAVYNKANGAGVASYPSGQQGGLVVGGGSLTTNPSNTVKASASIQPDLIFAITKYGGIKVPCVHYYFYLTGSVDINAVIAKLATQSITALQLPVFRTQSYTFTLQGSQAEVQVTAKTAVTTSFDTNSASAVTRSAYAYEWGSDYSENVSTSIKSVTIPDVIHSGFSITASDSETLSVSADGSTMAHGTVVNVAAITNTISRSKTANASVSPSSISATNPTTIPTSGKYIVDVSSEIGEYGYMLVHAVVVDFSVYA